MNFTHGAAAARNKNAFFVDSSTHDNGMVDRVVFLLRYTLQLHTRFCFFSFSRKMLLPCGSALISRARGTQPRPPQQPIEGWACLSCLRPDCTALCRKFIQNNKHSSWLGEPLSSLLHGWVGGPLGRDPVVGRSALDGVRIHNQQTSKKAHLASGLHRLEQYLWATSTRNHPYRCTAHCPSSYW